MEDQQAVIQELLEDKVEEEEDEVLQIQKQIDLLYNPDELKKMQDKKRVLIEELRKNFQDEEQLNKINYNKVLINWRNSIVSLNKKELLQQIDILSNGFSRALEIKQEFLDTLKDRYFESNKQYQLVLQNHELHINKLNDLRKIKISSIRQNLYSNLDLIQNEFEQEFEQIVQDRIRQLKNLNDMIESIKEEEQRKDNVQNENFSQLKEETKDKTTEEMELMVTEMNSKKVNIYNALENLFQKFITDSKEKFRKYTILMENNTKESKAIEETIKKIQKTKNKIKLTSLKIIQIKKEFEHKNSKIKKENDEIAKNFLELKNQMFSFRAQEKKKLVVLTNNTKLATEKLNKLEKQGERIITNTELCRKLEFENEKILPLYENTVEFCNLSQIEKEDFISSEEMGKFIKFKNYFKRYNKVLLDTIALKKERDIEKQKNQHFKHQLLKFMDNMTVTKYVMQDKENTLLKTQEMQLFREKITNNTAYVEGQHAFQNVYQYVKNQIINIYIKQLIIC